MQKKVVFGLGVAVFLILGVSVWQSGLDSKPRSEKATTVMSGEDAGTVEEGSFRMAPSPTPSVDAEGRKETQGTVSGTVRLKASGAPVGNVAIQAWSEGKPLGDRVASSDEKGSYTLTCLPSGIGFLLQTTGPSAEYYVDNRDYYILSVKPGEKKTGANIKLSQRQAGTISGTVVGRRVSYQNPDNPTSATKLSDYERKEDTALPNIKITLDSVLNVEGGMVHEPIIETITDQVGHFVFEAVRPGKYYVCAELPDGAAFMPERDPSRCYYADLIKTPLHENVQLYFRMDGVSIEGRVADTLGNPISGGEVVVSLAERPTRRGGYRRLQTHKISSVISNSKGEFHFDNLPAFDLVPGLMYIRGEEYNYEFRVECKAVGFCPGQVLLPPYPVNLLEAALKFDENLLKRLPEERIKDFHSADVKLPLGHENVITSVDFTLSPSGSISGRVVDSRGNNLLPIEEEGSSSTLIALVQSGSENMGPIQAECPRPFFLQKRSRFRFENVPPGNYVFDIISTRRVNQVTTRSRNKALVVREGETIENLEVVAESMADRGNITGHVVDAVTGQPVKDLSVEILRVNSPEEPNPQTGYVQTGSLPVGDFTIICLSPGKATLKISAPGYLPVQAELEVSSGQTSEQTFQLGGGGSLSGLVLDAETKEPIETFDVKVVSGEGEGKGKPIEGSVRKDETKKGAFLLSGLTPGRVTVEISKAPGYSDEAEEVEITAEKITEQTFLIQKRGSLVGQVTENGKASDGAEISARVVGKAMGDDATVYTDKNGDYKLEDLNTGDYTVLASVRYACGFKEGTHIWIYERVPLEIRPGKEIRQDFEFRGTSSLQGKFRASDRNYDWYLVVFDGTPSEGGTIDPVSNEKMRAIVVDLQKGDRYLIRSLMPGTYTFVARCCKRNEWEMPVAEKRQTVTLTEGQAATVDFEFP